MKTRSAKTELLTLLAAIHNEDVRALRYVLSQTKPEDFATNEGREIRDRLEKLTQLGKTIARETFSEDPALSKPAAEFIKAAPELLEAAAQTGKKKLDSYISTLRNLRKSRILLTSIQQIADSCKGPVSEELLSSAVESLYATANELRGDEARETQIKYGAGMTDERLKSLVYKLTTPDEREFITTGLDGLDAHIKGYRPGELVVMSAERNGGKTAIALQCAWKQYLAGNNVVFCSLEMPWETLEERLAAQVSGLYYSSIRTKFSNLSSSERKNTRARMYAKFLQEMKTVGDEKKCVFTALDKRENKYTPQQLEADLSTMMGTNVVWIDYMTLLHSNSKDLWSAQIDSSKYLKLMAKRLNLVVVVLTQLNTDGFVKYGRGAEEAADWWIKWAYGEQERLTGAVEIKLAKARATELCTVPARFNFSTMQIETSAPQKVTAAASPTKANEWSTDGV